MSVGCLVLVFTSIVDTVPLSLLATKAVLPSGVTATEPGRPPTAMSVGSLVLVFTSIVDTVPLSGFVTKTVCSPRPCRHRRHPVRDHTHQRARQPEHQHSKRPPEPQHRCPCLAIASARVAPSPATRRDRHPDRLRADCDVGGVRGPGLHINRRHRVATGLATKAVLPSGVTATPGGESRLRCRWGARPWSSRQSSTPCRLGGQLVGDVVGFAVGRDGHCPGARTERDVGRGSWSWSSRQSSTPCRPGDEGGLAVRCDRHSERPRVDGDVGGVLRPGLHVNRRHRCRTQRLALGRWRW